MYSAFSVYRVCIVYCTVHLVQGVYCVQCVMYIVYSAFSGYRARIVYSACSVVTDCDSFGALGPGMCFSYDNF